MRILILGGTGMLGHKLVQVLSGDFDVWATIRRPFSAVERFEMFDRERTIDDLDVAAADGLERAISTVKPDVVINAVGIIKQLEVSKDLNRSLPHRLNELSAEYGYRLVCISTDCVFSGERGCYTELDVPDASDEYGRSKAAGEVLGPNTLTIRTSIIGRELDTHHSLVEWFLSNRGRSVDGFTRVIYTGLTTLSSARILRRIITEQRELSGLFHVASDPISKYDLLKMINEAFRADVDIKPSHEMANDRSLDAGKFRVATCIPVPSWQDMIADMAADPTPYERFHGEDR